MTDKINPNHYVKQGVNCFNMIKVITSDLTGFDAVIVGKVTKYIWRYKNKNGVEDLKKARRCLDELIAEYEGGNNGDK